MLIVFDWDGTLIDSTHKIVTCMQRAAQLVELPLLPDNTVKSIIGLGLPEAIQTLYPEANEDKRQALRQAYSAHYIADDAIPSPLFEGVQQGLERLRNEGHLLAVATGKSRRGLERVLHSLDWLEYFDASRCADETASKPHPRMLLELMQQLAMPPQQTMMVGDTDFDLLMANNAGVNSVAVSYGAHPIERLRCCQPKAIIHQFSQLHTIITAHC